ncbi:MAG: hypothetical protein KJI69_06435 [Patescibacteria group bacterium]|nr:hypothetical protein [Patescibacteria group bacterium]
MIKEKNFKINESGLEFYGKSPKANLNQFKEKLQEYILDEEGYLKIPELEDLALEGDNLSKIVSEFLLTQEYKLKSDNLSEIFYSVDVLMEFLELEEIHTILHHYNEEKLEEELNNRITEIDNNFLESISCGLDIAVMLINKYLGQKNLIYFLDSFDRLEKILTLYTREETLTRIGDALKKGLKSKDNDFQKASSKVYKNGGLYFINLEGNGTYAYQLNKYITMKLEGNRTNIYVNNSLFNQCKFLFLNIPVKKIKNYSEIDSIDEAAEKLNGSMEGRSAESFEISPETEFWGHWCDMKSYD